MSKRIEEVAKLLDKVLLQLKRDGAVRALETDELSIMEIMQATRRVIARKKGKDKP